LAPTFPHRHGRAKARSASCARVRADDPAIHVFVVAQKKGVDARDKPGHDEQLLRVGCFDSPRFFNMREPFLFAIRRVEAPRKKSSLGPSRHGPSVFGKPFVVALAEVLTIEIAHAD
jgi:hypothetical protein